MGSKQKTVIVTGASQGIGAGVVQAFLDRGYNVVANSRNITKSDAFTESAQLALVDGNIGDSAVAAKVVDTAISRFGSIDALVNNAGIFLLKHSLTIQPTTSRRFHPLTSKAFSTSRKEL
jgi:NAD(P)-dependent dehydrogenase (short-subunit alcohol dehydrogenase family)